jgi:hypothetical protein
MVQLGKTGLRQKACGLSCGWPPRTRRWSIHASRNLSRAPSASLRDRLRRPWTEPACRKVSQQSGSGEGPGQHNGAAGAPVQAWRRRRLAWPRLSVGHDRRRRCLANPDAVRRPQDDSCGRARRVRELQTNSPFCKPICKPDAARQHETGETEPTERDGICPVRRGHHTRERLRGTPETHVVWLITQRSRVQIPPPLLIPQIKGLFRSREGPLAYPCSNGRGISPNITLLCFGDTGRTPERCQLLLRM